MAECQRRTIREGLTLGWKTNRFKLINNKPGNTVEQCKDMGQDSKPSSPFAADSLDSFNPSIETREPLGIHPWERVLLMRVRISLQLDQSRSGACDSIRNLLYLG